ncbi:hypothetical protein PENTCL1PPCAC_19774, partial [Pristionchus entomophagus]
NWRSPWTAERALEKIPSEIPGCFLVPGSWSMSKKRRWLRERLLRFTISAFTIMHERLRAGQATGSSVSFDPGARSNSLAKKKMAS